MDGQSAFIEALSGIRKALDKVVETVGIYQESKAAQAEKKAEAESKAVVRLPVEIPRSYEAENADRKSNARRDRIRLVLEIIGVGAAIFLAILTLRTLHAVNGQLGQGKRANNDLERQFFEQQRPWVKISIRIVKPLAFGVPAGQGPVAKIELEDTIENVGQSPALNVFAWEDVIPIDSDYSSRSAELRQTQYCDANRHPHNSPSLSGEILFPKDPHVEGFIAGPPMKTVMESVRRSPIQGKVSFVLVGCVYYRASFDPPGTPTHQTRFLYPLGIPQGNGLVMPWVVPSGQPPLQIITNMGKISAD